MERHTLVSWADPCISDRGDNERTRRREQLSS
jgi:hypothetical protein